MAGPNLLAVTVGNVEFVVVTVLVEVQGAHATEAGVDLEVRVRAWVARSCARAISV